MARCPFSTSISFNTSKLDKPGSYFPYHSPQSWHCVNIQLGMKTLPRNRFTYLFPPSITPASTSNVAWTCPINFETFHLHIRHDIHFDFHFKLKFLTRNSAWGGVVVTSGSIPIHSSQPRLIETMSSTCWLHVSVYHSFAHTHARVKHSSLHSSLCLHTVSS